MNGPILRAEKLIAYLRQKKVLKLDQVTDEVIFYFSSVLPKNLNFKESEIQNVLGAKYLNLDNNRSILFDFGIGAPSAVSKMEEMKALGAKKVVFLGSAGGLSSEQKIGEVFLIEKAFSDEGTSKHYSDKDQNCFKADKDLLEDLKTRLGQNKVSFSMASAWTTDAPYRETAEKMDHFLKLGATVVDMEASAGFAAATSLGVKASAVFVVSDLVLKSGWVPGFGFKALNQNKAEVLGAMAFGR